MSFVYVSNAVSGDVSVMHMAVNGELRLLPAVAVGGSPAPMAFSPAHAMLHVARRGQANAVMSYAVHTETGALAPPVTTPLGAKMSYLALDHTATCLIGVSYHSHHLSVLRLSSDGLPQGQAQVLVTPLHPHSVVFSACNRYALVACLGADVLQVYRFDASNGQLSPQPVCEWLSRAGSGPRHFRFSPSGTHVYVLNELDASLDVLSWEGHNAQLQHVQTLSTLPPGFQGKPWAADVHLTADGVFLLSCERSSSTMALFRVDRESGKLSLVSHTPVETQPRAFAIEASTQQVLVAGQLSHHLARYRINGAAGSLDLLQRVPVGQEPLWVQIVD